MASDTNKVKPLDLFGQLVIGPPGSGKTTYCNSMTDYLQSIGRNAQVINLDPANDHLPYKCAVDIRHLIRLDDVMQSLQLGPNGGLVYCIDYLLANKDWLARQLTELSAASPQSPPYLLFDCPGQVELYTHHPSMRQLINFLTHQFSSTTPNEDGLGLRLTAVHLVDSHYCSDPGKYIACLLTSLTAMLQLSLPHVNVLSKADLVEAFGQLAFNLDFFTEVLDLEKLAVLIDADPFYTRYGRLNRALIDLIERHSLVRFSLLDARNHQLLEQLAAIVDKANGYVFGPSERHNLQAMMQVASGVDFASDWVGLVQESYMSDEKRGEGPSITENIDLFE